jgi:hypothetical protein
VLLQPFAGAFFLIKTRIDPEQLITHCFMSPPWPNSSLAIISDGQEATSRIVRWAARWVGSTATPADAHDRYFAKVQEDQPSRAGNKPPSRRTCPRISTEEQAVQFRHKII